MTKKQRDLFWIMYTIISIGLTALEEWRFMGICMLLIGLIMFVFRGERNRNRAKREWIIQAYEHLKGHDKEFEADNELSLMNYKIAVSEKKETIKLYEMDESNQIKETLINFGDIMESELQIDSQTIMKASRGNQVAGALVGNLVAGSIGAIIGGSSPNMIQNEKTQSITLKITTEDIKNPIHKFEFLPPMEGNHTGYEKNNPVLKQALERAEYWNSVIDIAIRKSNKKLG